MRKPQSPPVLDRILQDALKGRRLESVFLALDRLEAPPKYLHWDELRFLKPPPGFSHEEWWAVLKMQRKSASKRVPLTGTDGRPFTYVLTDAVLEGLHHIDTQAGGAIATEHPMPDTSVQDRFLVSSLIEEAITSSQLEGAATTREDAKDMIRSGRRPRNHSERMILNNYLTMERIRHLKDEPLSRRTVLEIHRIVTKDTLKDEVDSGRLRDPHRKIDVGDYYGQVFHDPPPAAALGERMEAMCDFANTKTPEQYLHPVLRSIVLHFWLAYDHPFVDGNGRTARALFYWCMLRYGFWLCEYISISEFMRRAPSKYGRAFLYTETDDNDLTYFIMYHLDVIRRAIRHLHEYVQQKQQELRSLDRRLLAMATLNERQRALIAHALRNPRFRYTIESHQRSHDVVYQTARTDLLDLADRGLLHKRKVGRRWNFTPTPDLSERLRERMT